MKKILFAIMIGIISWSGCCEPFHVNRTVAEASVNPEVLYHNQKGAELRKEWEKETRRMKDYGKLDIAKAEFEQALALDPNYAVTYFNLGTISILKRSFLGALQWYDKCIELDPDYVPAYYDKGGIYYTLGDYDTAYEFYTIAIERGFKMTWENSDVYMKTCLKSGHYEKTLEICDSLEKENPRWIAVWNHNRAKAYLGLGDYPNALKCIELSLKKRSPNYEAFITKGEIYLAQGDIDKAIEWFDKAINMAPSVKKANELKKMAESKKT